MDIFISDSVRAKKDKDRRQRWVYIMIKESSHQKGILTLNVYAPNNRAKNKANTEQNAEIS
jgi:hypothetical protein